MKQADLKLNQSSSDRGTILHGPWSMEPEVPYTMDHRSERAGIEQKPDKEGRN